MFLIVYLLDDFQEMNQTSSKQMMFMFYSDLPPGKKQNTSPINKTQVLNQVYMRIYMFRNVFIYIYTIFRYYIYTHIGGYNPLNILPCRS